MKINRFVFLNLIIVVLVGCQTRWRTNLPTQTVTNYEINPARTVTVFNTTPDRKKVSALVITSGKDLVDFGWLPDGHIYYGIGGDPSVNSAELATDINETSWYSYSLKNHESARVTRPYPRLSTDTIQLMKYGQTNQILYMTISPSMKKALYTRLPDNYERPKPLPHEYVDPVEIWIAENLSGFQEERTAYALSDNSNQLYDCGSALSAESRWFSAETLVFGSCYFTYGIVRVYFLADLLSRKIQFLNFENESGKYVPTEEIAVAHNGPSLAFQTDEGFWVVPVEKSVREIPLKLTELNFLFNDRPAIAPIWSLDDQWIYYWTFGRPQKIDQNGFVEYQPWWFEKINIATRQREVILSEKQLLSLMGYDMYRRNTPLGIGNSWRLYPDEKAVLIFMNETIDSPATLLFISWQH